VAITNATLREVERLRRQLTRMTDAQTRALTAAWADAWDVLLPEFEIAFAQLITTPGAVPASVVARNIRLQAALTTARAHLDVLAQQVEGIATADLSQTVLDAVDSHAAVIASQLPAVPAGHAGVAVNFNRVPHEALVAIVERTTQQIHAATIPLPADVERIMKRALVRGIAVGAHPRKTAARMLKEAEGRFNGGLTRALNIARTETMDAHRAATQVSEKANREVLAEWEWSASLDRRTCPSCLAKHGQRFPLEEQGPEDHQQGRCARVSVTKTWKELGFDIPEPRSATRDSREWFDSLTPDTQREILGPTRLKLLQDGDIAWADLSSKRTTAGWRDSYGVTAVKDLIPKE